MIAQDDTGKNFQDNKVCILIPTFNNALTLKPLISEILLYGTHIIVVNDGSTDETEEILSGFPQIQTLSYASNRGKGYALRKGFHAATDAGFDYVISIDSDGQHYPRDLPAFLKKLQDNPGSLIIGARNMEQASVPSKSSFGHRFSNFWFRVETGIRLPDTQSGYRLYPVARLRAMRFFTRKFEFEIEVIVRAAWSGIPVISVPVSVYYPPAGERISHFRPFKDFTRISILNTFLVLISFLYIRPRDLLRKLFLKHKWKEVFVTELFDPLQTDTRKSVSVGFGVCMGILPIWGFQLISAIALAVLFRLNKGLVILFANISIPPAIPLILYASFKMGEWWMPGSHVPFSMTKSLSLQVVGYQFWQYLAGSISLALLAGFTAGLISYLLLKLFGRKNRAIG